MAAALHSFISIFGSEFTDGQQEPVTLREIVIPIIQRDYAQGRRDASVSRIRNRFLKALKDAIEGDPITLDFIYGDIDSNGRMTPLDGQQRLTTLFLIHWYASKKENIDQSECEFLSHFTYETRFSARDFCTSLVDFSPEFNTAPLSKQIIDQPWFPLSWKKDPTIDSMLVMIDEIKDRFYGVDNLWNHLKEGKIVFYFLPIKDMGLTDELYIKMNSRGKPLTMFEHFKAELEHSLRAIDPSTAPRVMKEIDVVWTDMLWQYCGDDHLIDDEFLRYFRFICDIICYKHEGTPYGTRKDEFDLLQSFFDSSDQSVLSNVQILEGYFNCWCSFGKGEIEAFFDDVFTYTHESEKTLIDHRYEINIFHDCLRNYADVRGNRNRSFPLGRIILLYACVQYLINKETISITEFKARIRVVNNLIQNSEDEISDSPFRKSGNRLPAILRQVDSIILTGKINDEEDNNFNKVQIAEEIDKQDWLQRNPNKTEELHRLEDHELLFGQISIVGLDHSDHFERFESLFKCDLDLVDCSLIAQGDYSQQDRNKWRYQLGSGSSTIKKAWTNLFHKSSASHFDETKKILSDLLNKHASFTDEDLRAIIRDYKDSCEKAKTFDWRYYYLSYKAFRPSRYGKYAWEDDKSRPYEMTVIWAPERYSSKAYQPFLKAVTEIISKNDISLDDNGQCAIIGTHRIECENSRYIKKDVNTEKVIEVLSINQNSEGIDTEDRIQKAIATGFFS